MADITDEASELELLQNRVAISAQLAKPRLNEKNTCYNCNKTINRGLFCDSYCGEDYDREQWAIKNRVR